MKRHRATALIEELVQHVAAGGQYLDCIDEIWVFGSYARGALDPGDIDLEIEYTADEELWDFQIRKLASGGDWLEPLHRAVIAGRRGFQISYDRRDLYEKKGIELTLLWRRGDRLPTALARLHAIAPDAAAGRAPREAMLPAFENIDRWVPLPIRQALVKQVEAGTLSVKRIDLEDAQPHDPSALRYVCDRWQDTSPMRRAGLAALAHIERHGGNPHAVHLQGRDVLQRDTPHFVGFRWRFYQRIPMCLTEWGGEEWIEVVNPTRARPMHALRIVPLDRQRLRYEQF